MKYLIAALAALGSYINTVGAFDNADLAQGTYCFTYLSTFLEPVSVETVRPRPSVDPALDSSLIGQSSSRTADGQDLEPTDYTEPFPNRSSATATVPNSALTDITEVILPTSSSADFGPVGQRVIFLVTPSGDINKRELNGFVGDNNPDVCTFAAVFTLGQDQLFNGNVPLGYDGGDYQSFQTQPLADDAITRSFTNAGGNLQFRNSALPNGQAAFCQDSSDGQVYMTFTSEPPSCIPVVLAVYGVEQCVDGRLIGFNDPTTTDAQSVVPSISSIIDTTEAGPTDIPVTSVSDQPVDTEPLPEQPTTDLATRTFTSLPPFWANTSRTEIPSIDPTVPIEPTSLETSDNNSPLVPSDTDIESSSGSQIFVPDSTALFVPTSSESSEGQPSIFPTNVESSSESKIFTEPTTGTPPPPDVETLSSSQISFTESTTSLESLQSTEYSETDTLLPSSSESSPFSDEISTTTTMNIMSTSATDSLESLTGITSQTTDAPSTTPPDLPTTTTSEDDIIITNRIANGRFAMADPNSPSGLEGYDSEGEVRHQLGGCFKDDNSADDGCVALEAVGDSPKRFIGSFAGISQLLGFLQPSTTVLYTVQFYYAVITGGGFQTCTVSAYLGNRQFYSMSLFSIGQSVSWNRVLTSVIADSRSANFGISMTCMGDGQAMIYVDSVFVSNQVTPRNIDEFQLDFGATPPESQAPSKISSTSRPTSDSWLPEPDTSSGTWEHSTPTPVGTKSWLPQPDTSELSTPSRTPTSWLPLPDTHSETSTPIPTPTREEDPTTTSHTTSESETPTELCKYTHGEECEFDRFNYPQDALCAYGAYFTGPTWTESRTNYPHQDNPYQCIAICHGMENCESVGYWQLENRCIFTNVRIKQSDFIIYDTQGGSWQHSYWVDKRCWKCPDCIEASVPNTPPERCSYKEGDACSRNDVPESAICNFEAFMGGGYWTGDQWIEQYPRQDSAGACAAICQAIRDCKGSAYKDGRCRFSAFKLSTTDGPIPLDTTRDPSMNWPWDDPSCFTCPGCTE
ncbi:hypothetical protein NW762_013703 [Fusarium torreyae]|uniref:DUF7908 domain-containing protein n=1 Tax=Fusarium torreyae TaxID=1237075 RepID=A0A9W8RNA1_9HYPO|nr:hypothetical protein NW762_013703 [Fusarium torreyae]